MGRHRQGALASKALVQRLLQAADSGDLAGIQELLSRGLSVDAQDGFGRSPLFCAARGGHVRVSDWLLRSGASVDLSNAAGVTPLAIAAEHGREEAVEALLSARADVHKAHLCGDTALTLAVRCGQAGVVRLLLQGGASASATREDGWPPLHLAVKHRHAEVIPALLEAGADPDGVQVTRWGTGRTTLLHEAAYSLQLAAVEALLEGGADPTLLNENGQNALALLRSRGAGWFADPVDAVVRAAIEETLRQHEEAHHRQFVLQLSVLAPNIGEQEMTSDGLGLPSSVSSTTELAVLTFRTLAGNVAATLPWDMTRPVAGLPMQLRNAIRSSGFQCPFQPLSAGHLRIVLPTGVLLEAGLRELTLEQHLARKPGIPG